MSVAKDWSPHVLAAAEEMYVRLNVLNSQPVWAELDIDAKDHYCVAAKLTVAAFNRSALNDVPAPWSSIMPEIDFMRRDA